MIRVDPLGRLAEIAGYEDGERWWDHLVESRHDKSGAVFDTIKDAMAALREKSEDAPSHPDERMESRREAHMRKTIRAAMAEGCERIAVVCGAWHAPALSGSDSKGAAAADNAILKGLPKAKTAVAWAPWSYDRLTFASGYGAGVASPAYYEMVWKRGGDVATHWLTRAARLLRNKDIDVSSAHVIESCRLAATLAAYRGRPQPGLEDLIDAVESVLCAGQSAPLQLIRQKLIVGDRLGEVPEEAPATPLQQDLKSQQKSLRLAPSAVEKDYDFDLRKPMDLDRSHLLHRLNLLGIPWGELREEHGKKGTFHEFWRLTWKPEFVINLISAGRWGNTLEAAATAFAANQAKSADNLAALVALLDHALLAELPDAIAALIDAVQRQSAVGADVLQLMDALPPLARVSRYSNVRRHDTEMVTGVVDGLVVRICAGLTGAIASLDEDAARAMVGRINAVHDAISLLNRASQAELWNETLTRLVDQTGLHALVAGRAARLLHDSGLLSSEEASRRLCLALSTGNDPLQGAAWIEGFLGDSGQLLIHDPAIWSIVDAWVCDLSADHFTTVLALLRRTFANFPAAERRQMGERMGKADARPTTVAAAADFDIQSADRVMPLIGAILGLEAPK